MIISFETMQGNRVNCTKEQLIQEISKKVAEGGQGKAVRFFREILRRATYQTPVYKQVEWGLGYNPVDDYQIEGGNSLEADYTVDLSGNGSADGWI